jgi:lysophospholipase L1-like esterase
MLTALWGAQCVMAAAVSTQAADTQQSWVRAWGTAVMAPEELDYYPDLGRSFQDVTLRQVIVTTLAGESLRVLLSNEHGSAPLLVGRAYVARVRRPPDIEVASERPLRFKGQRSVSIPAGAAVYSDPLDWPTAAESALAISLFLPNSTAGSPSTVHEEGWRLGYVSPRGDFAAAASFPGDARLHSYFYVAAVDVRPKRPAAAIVTLGDSITDGTGATPLSGRTWPDNLARRLITVMPGQLSVINMAIGGNRVLHDATGPSAVSRVDHDVFAVPGARYLILLEGINDIAGWPEHPEQNVSAAQLIDGLRELIVRAHAHGLRVIGGTLTPTEGCPDCGGAEGEAIRQAVNEWIRRSQEFDAVVDFDRVVGDRANPRRLAAAYDCGDHLHLSDAGYVAMAQAIDLTFFQDISNRKR